VPQQVRGSRGQTSKDAIVSQLTGMKIGAYDPNKNALNRAYDYRNELQKQINDAQDQGQVGKAKRLRKQQQQVYNRIRKLRTAQGLPVTPKRKRSSGGGWGAASGVGSSSGGGWGAAAGLGGR
jgi:hypothetical protein